jgi:hypothetical protein
MVSTIVEHILKKGNQINYYDEVLEVLEKYMFFFLIQGFALAGLELSIFLLPPLECWDCRRYAITTSISYSNDWLH